LVDYGWTQGLWRSMVQAANRGSIGLERGQQIDRYKSPLRRNWNGYWKIRSWFRWKSGGRARLSHRHHRDHLPCYGKRESLREVPRATIDSLSFRLRGAIP